MCDTISNMEHIDYSPTPPEKGIVAEVAHSAREQVSNIAARYHEGKAKRAVDRAERLMRCQDVASEVLSFAGINPPTPEPATKNPSVPPTFIQRRRERKWASHALKRSLRTYDPSLHSPYSGTWQSDLMSLTSSVSRFFARREAGKSYKSGEISAVEALQHRTAINSRNRGDFVPKAVHGALASTSSAFSGDTLLRARTYGFNRSGGIERLEQKTKTHLDKAEKAEQRSKALSSKRTQLNIARKNWQTTKRTQPIV